MSSKARGTIDRFVSSRKFETAITVIVILNSISLGLQTTQLPEGLSIALNVFDSVCLFVYVIETVLKLAAWHTDYFKSKWNIFDFTVIALSIVPSSILPLPVEIARIFRVFRALRTFRLVSAFKKVRVIIDTILKSLPSVAWTMTLLAIISYAFAVIGVNLYGEAFPEFFGSLPRAAFTLFQLTTLEGWPDIARKVIDVSPMAWLYFIPYILVAAFIVVNVVVGIIVNCLEQSQMEQSIEGIQESESDLKSEIAEMREQITEMKNLLERNMNP